MVLAAQAVEDTASLGDGMTARTVTGGLLLLGVGLAALAGARLVTAQDTKELVAPYLRALDERAVGELVGRAYGDPPRASAPEVPHEGVSVLLFPYSAGFESELDGIKEHLRDSLNSYMAAATDVTSARTAYEQALLWAGGGELIRGEVSDAKGLVKLAGVPAGEWLLLAWREDARPGKAVKPRAQDTKAFGDIPTSAGYSVVSYWWMRLQVRTGETTSVDFNDRNVWITTIREAFYLMQPPPRRSNPGRRR